MEMPLVGSVPACPKCALPSVEGGVRMIYHRQVPNDSFILQLSPCLRLLNEMHQEIGEEAPDSIEVIGEHLCRICTRCQYGWVERPMDTEPKDDDDAGL